MLKATDFIDLNIRNIEQEQKRVGDLIRALPKESAETRSRIANEFLEIVQDRDERRTRRSQAAFMLGGSAKSLGIKGSISFAEALVKTIEAEFLLGRSSLRSNVRGRTGSIVQLEFSSLVFLQGLVLSILVIDPVAGGNIVKRLYPRIVDVQFLEWLEQVSKMAPS